MIVLSLCDYTGNIVQSWAEAGYECWIVDIQHPEGIGPKRGNIRKVGMNIKDFKLPDEQIKFMCAFPPCDHLAISGACWFKGKGLLLLAKSIFYVGICAELCEESKAPYFIENPIGTLSTYWRAPNFVFDPYNYAGYSDLSEAYTKRTCLWTGNGFIMPQPKGLPNIHSSKARQMPESKDRHQLRAETPKGFAKAVFLANNHD